MKHNIAAVAAILLLVSSLLILGCGSQADSAKNADSEPLQVTIHTNMVGSALTVLAQNAGFYAEEGVPVQLQVMNGPSSDSLSALATGKVALTTGGIGSAAPLRMIDGGADFVIIGGQMSEGADLVTLPEKKREWENLTAESVQGKRIGVIRASSGDIALRGALVRRGIDLSTIQFVELANEPTIIEAVKKGEVDVGNVATNLRDTAHEQGLVSSLHVDELAPDFICCRLVTTSQEIAAHRPELVRFLRAQLKAYRMLKNEPEKTLALVHQTIEVDDKILRSQLYTYGHFKLSPDPTGERVVDFYDTMRYVGYIEGKADIAKHIDTSLYQEALASLLAEEPEEPVWQQLREEYKRNDGAWPGGGDHA